MTSADRRGPILYRADRAAGGAAWAAGPWGEREFASAASGGAASRDWVRFSDMESAIVGLQSRPAPHTLLLPQPRPGMVSQDQVNRFLAAAPLAEVVVVAGSWCEGELRTGQPLLGVRRVYWHQLGGWLRRQMPERHSAAPHWAAAAMPDASAELTSEGAAALRDAAVAIDSIDYATFETLDDGLRTYVRTCHWTPRGRSEVGAAEVGIWDGGQLDGDEGAALARFCERMGRNAAVVALVDFPRAEHLKWVADAGAVGVIGKPYLVGEVAYQLSSAALSRKRQVAASVTRNP